MKATITPQKTAELLFEKFGNNTFTFCDYKVFCTKKYRETLENKGFDFISAITIARQLTGSSLSDSIKQSNSFIFDHVGYSFPQLKTLVKNGLIKQHTTLQNGKSIAYYQVAVLQQEEIKC